MTNIKICGISTLNSYLHCAENDVDYIGFVFFDKSPRHLDLDVAAQLADRADDALKDKKQNAPKRIALSVNADNAMLEEIINHARPNILQLHGHESPERTNEIKQIFGLPVMPVIQVSNRADIDAAAAYFSVADILLFDAAPECGAELPGGMGAQFDWNLMRDANIPIPWMLGGGLNSDNVAEAITLSGADCVDVSSGVEKKRGEKSLSAISRFVKSAKFG